MSAMWRRAMLYLGLGPDEEYDDYEAYEDSDVVAHAGTPAAGESYGTMAPVPQPSSLSSAPPMVAEPRQEASAISAVRPLQPEQPADALTGEGGVTPIAPAPSAKPYVVSPTSFNSAQEVADRFKASQPVIVNLQGGSRELSRRLIDFTSGLCYGLGGQMEKVANQVYLLTPDDVEVSDEERRRLRERGLYDS